MVEGNIRNRRQVGDTLTCKRHPFGRFKGHVFEDVYEFERQDESHQDDDDDDSCSCTSSSSSSSNSHDGFALLNVGAYGKVYKGYVKDSCPKEEYAIKVIDSTGCQREDENVIYEAKLLKDLRNQNVRGIVQIVDFFVSTHSMSNNKKMYIVQTLAQGGDVLDRIATKDVFTEYDARLLAQNILRTIQEIHSHNVVHRDLKPENILLQYPHDDTQIMICDFGCAKYLPQNPHRGLRTLCGTPAFTAPEMILHDEYREHVDIWSIGCLLFMILCGYFPFDAENEEEIYEKIINNDYEFDDYQIWDTISDDGKDFISSLLVIDKDQRATAQQALECDWFSNTQIDPKTSTSTVTTTTTTHNKEIETQEPNKQPEKQQPLSSPPTPLLVMASTSSSSNSRNSNRSITDDTIVQNNPEDEYPGGNLRYSLNGIRRYVLKRKFKGAVQAIRFTNTLSFLAKTARDTKAAIATTTTTNNTLPTPKIGNHTTPTTITATPFQNHNGKTHKFPPFKNNNNSETHTTSSFPRTTITTPNNDNNNNSSSTTLSPFQNNRNIYTSPFRNPNRETHTTSSSRTTIATLNNNTTITTFNSNDCNHHNDHDDDADTASSTSVNYEGEEEYPHHHHHQQQPPATTQPKSSSSPNGGDGGGGDCYYSLQDLQKRSIPNIDYSKCENYLSDDDHYQVFGARRSEVATWKAWKIIQKKRDCRIF